MNGEACNFSFFSLLSQALSKLYGDKSIKLFLKTHANYFCVSPSLV